MIQTHLFATRISLSGSKSEGIWNIIPTGQAALLYCDSEVVEIILSASSKVPAMVGDGETLRDLAGDRQDRNTAFNIINKYYQ